MDKLFEQIESLQKKPAHVRKRILFVATGVASALIFFFWLSIFPATLNKIEDRSAQTASSVSPFTSLLGTIREAGKSISSVGKDVEAQVRYVRDKTANISATPTIPKIEKTEDLTPTSSPKQAGE